MTQSFLFLSMIFFHIIDDYYLQGILASMKKKTWWLEQAKNTENIKNKYDDIPYPKQKLSTKHDYVWALIMHSFSWSFMIMLPLAYAMRFRFTIPFVLMFSINVIIHAITDHAKANLGLLNLWADQLIHLAQIIATFIFFSIHY